MVIADQPTPAVERRPLVYFGQRDADLAQALVDVFPFLPQSIVHRFAAMCCPEVPGRDAPSARSAASDEGDYDVRCVAVEVLSTAVIDGRRERNGVSGSAGRAAIPTSHSGKGSSFITGRAVA